MRKRSLAYMIAALSACGMSVLLLCTKQAGVAVAFIIAFLFCVYGVIAEKTQERKQAQLDARHSEAYKRLRQVANSGYERANGGFDPNLFDKIYDWEREETEDYIWNLFQNQGYTDLAPLLPKLGKYDGIQALRDKRDTLDDSCIAAKIIADVLEQIVNK